MTLTALEQHRGTAADSESERIRQGWFLKKDATKQGLLAEVSGKAGEADYGEAVQESTEFTAEGVLPGRWERRKWDEQTSWTRRKGDAARVAVARRLRRGVDPV